MNEKTLNTAPRFVIVIGLDATSEADAVLEAGSTFARGIAGAELHVVHAVEPPETKGVEGYEKAVERARAYLDQRSLGAAGRSGVPVIGHLRVAPAAPAILQTASSVDADLIVVGTHDRKGIAHWAFGSVAERIAREATCPVLIMRPKHNAVPRAPQIEPPCDDCVQTQRESRGATLWCARHREHHAHGRLHYETPQGFGEGSSLVRS